MPVKLHIEVSRVSLIFQKRFPDVVNTYGRSYMASTDCTRSHIATTKQKIITSKIRKNYPLKSSYVAPRVVGTIFLVTIQAIGQSPTHMKKLFVCEFYSYESILQVGSRSLADEWSVVCFLFYKSVCCIL